MTTPSDIARYRANWQKEIDGAFQYRALADTEKDEKLAEVYRRLASTEEKHAAVWEFEAQGGWAAPACPKAFLARPYHGSIGPLVRLEFCPRLHCGE